MAGHDLCVIKDSLKRHIGGELRAGYPERLELITTPRFRDPYNYALMFIYAVLPLRPPT